ncbi:MAG: hypothetical protein JRD89_02190 [Deltaproteobacteria bacterium]|nr:hypothetical protein [Deltaproteobacteria bacterium]
MTNYANYAKKYWTTRTEDWGKLVEINNILLKSLELKNTDMLIGAALSGGDPIALAKQIMGTPDKS